MNIQGFQKITLLDFPTKVACTVFTGGCNLRCPFCHNASLVNNPNEQQSMENSVFDYLKERHGILDGVCLTGGEPLLQPDIEEFTKKLKDMGFLVKLDTNGYLPYRLEKLLKSNMVDYVAMDIKSSLQNYEKATGCKIDTARFLESVNIIKNSGIDYEFRTTAVKGIHTEEDFEAIGEWLKGEKRYFIQKFVDSGNTLTTGWEAFSDIEMQNLLKIVRKSIPDAQLRG